jgi:hypothetical protein
VREAIVDWGIPLVARTDNGLDYKSNHVEQIFSALTIKQEKTNPYSGWEKPFIERFFRTFSHGIAELLQGFIGHNVAERQQISARLTFAERLIEKRKKGEKRVAINVDLSSDKFSKYMNDWLNFHYLHTEHSELGCSPFEKFTQHKQSIKKIEDERTLDILLAPIPNNKGIRTVAKDKGIELENNSYIHPELSLHIRKKVLCRYNPKDVGKVYVFDLETCEFICEATCPEIAGEGITRQDVAIAAKQRQRQLLTRQRKEVIRESRKNSVSDIAHEIIAHKKNLNGGLTSFPKPFENLKTPAIDAVVEATTKETEPTYTQEQINVFEKRKQELDSLWNGEDQSPEFKDDHHKARYLTQRKELATITPLEKAFLHKYREEYPSSARMLDALLDKTENQ